MGHLTNDNVPYIKELLKLERPDVLCLNEYGVDPETPAHFSFDGFYLQSCDLKGRNAGTAIFVRTYLRAFVEDVYIPNKRSLAQASAFSLNGCRIASMYRSPSQKLRDVNTFLDLLDTVVVGPTVILSDMNLPGADWTTYSSENSLHRRVVEKCSEKMLLQFQFAPSFKRSSNVLDIVLSNDHERVIDVRLNTVWSDPSIDHLPVIVKLDVSTEIENWIEVQPKKSIDYDVFQALMAEVDFITVTNTHSIERINTFVRDRILEAANVATPKRVIDLKQVNHNPVMSMSDNSAKLFRQKTELLGRGDFNGAKIKQSQLRSSLRQDKKRWMNLTARRLDSNTNEVWKIIQSASSKGVATGGLRLDDTTEELEFRPQEKAEILNRRYASVLTPKTLPTCDPDDPHQCEVQFGLTTIEFTPGDVVDALKEANNSYASDSVGLNMAMFRKISILVAPVLAFLFNLSMQTSTLALEWLLALINPIPKQGDPTLAKSYRPVALEHTILRIMEAIVNKKIVAYLDSIGFWHPKQYGFRKFHSCIHNMLDYWSFVSDLMERKGAVDVVYGDTSAAFDRLSHGLVLDKLFHHCGIASKLWKWLQAWTTGRQQFVKLNGYSSTRTDVTSSCLQGSCLGTTLWNIYVNDLCYYLEELIYDLGFEDGDICFFLYADDIKIAYYPSQENIAKVNRLLEKLCLEMERLYLVFNASKCSVLTMGKNNPRLDVFMKNSDGTRTLLSRVDVERDLGIQVSADGQFKEMKKKSLNTMKVTARFLGKIFHTATWNLKVQTYYSHIFSRGSYGSELWGSFNEKEKESFNQPWLDYFKFAKIPKNGIPPYLPTQIMQRKDLSMLYDVYHARAPVDEWKIFPEQQSTYNTRARSKGTYSRAKHHTWNKNLLYNRNHDIWVSIPAAVRDSPNKDYFMSYIDSNIIEKLPCNSYRDEMITGELRRKAKKQLSFIEESRKMSDFAESCGFPRWAKPDTYIDDPDFDDDFVVSDVCQKVKSTKSRTTQNILAIYAPYMLLCHCADPVCAEEIIQFEKMHGSIRYFPKAFVVNGVPRTRFGEMKIPFSSQWL